jgi:hypothetical protein
MQDKLITFHKNNYETYKLKLEKLDSTKHEYHMLKKTFETQIHESKYLFTILENMNPKDTITVDVPLFIRLLEYAREDAKTDMDLHNVAERAISLSTESECLGMESYDSIVGQSEQLAEMRKLFQVRAGIIK